MIEAEGVVVTGEKDRKSFGVVEMFYILIVVVILNACMHFLKLHQTIHLLHILLFINYTSI